ncbi:hypothetical protein BDV24DRAFT_166218 [Aspergillus arachidicola]|uniref:Uncharacterized protein n=1 Tax=Aspergillus arachidicola TaxID=656916 RepID=A0A2G7G000_9EURO|nr:hypothetical protein BDV24DRAFT_166218 [Aspergillus arachidicola]PIG86179.1 hypothetical protein AARAC_006210 [Aspergillus arachidicola]
MSKSNQFQFRSASLAHDDTQFIIAAFDSTLPYLTPIGFGGMWGERPFSQREGFEQDTVKSIKKPEQDQDRIHVFIAEAETPDSVNRNEHTGRKTVCACWGCGIM